MNFKKIREKNPHYLWWVHGHRCIICQKWPVHAHHVKTRGAGGDDTCAVPLCPDHHTGNQGIHILGQKTWAKKFNVDLNEVVEHLNIAYNQGMVGDMMQYLQPFDEKKISH